MLTSELEQNAKLVQQFDSPVKSLHTGPKGGSVYTQKILMLRHKM